MLLFGRGSESKTFQVNSWIPVPLDWIGMREDKGWHSYSMALHLGIFWKQYSKTFPSHASTFSCGYTCLLLDISTVKTCNTDVFRADEPGIGISGATSFNFNSDLPCPGKVNITTTVTPSVRERNQTNIWEAVGSLQKQLVIFMAFSC